jgi:uncharacterized protein with HEPN domain
MPFAIIRFVDRVSLDDYLADVRNRIAHGYFGIDDTVLFTKVDQDLQPLLPRLEALAREHGVGQ